MNYKTLFQETGVFEENAYQRVVMAIRIGDPRQIYVINSIEQDKVPFFQYDTLKEHLTNLAYIEQNEGRMVLVTHFKEGKGLSQYLSENAPSEAQREQLAQQYLVHLQHYEALPMPLQYLLCDHPQFVVQGDQLIANELLIFDRKLPLEMPFSKVIDRIGATLTLLVPGEHRLLQTLASTDVGAFDSLAAFVKHLLFAAETYTGHYDTIEGPEVPEAPEAIIAEPEVLVASEPAVPVDEKPVEDKPVVDEGLVDEKPVGIVLDTLIVKEKNLQEEAPVTFKRRRNFNPVLVLVTIAAVILAIVLGTGRIMDAVAAPLPLADFTISVDSNAIVLKDQSKVTTTTGNNVIYEWQWTGTMNDKQVFSSSVQNPIVPVQESGTYTFTLKVKDANKWSAPKTLSFEVMSVNGKWISRPNAADQTAPKPAEPNPAEETLSTTWMHFGTSNITWDTSQFNSGNQSVKVDLTSPNSEAVLELTPTELHRLSDMSFYLFTNDTFDLHVKIEAVKGDQVLAVEALDYTPETAGLWNLVDWSVNPQNFNTKQADGLRLTFTTTRPATLWLDDFSFGTYK